MKVCERCGTALAENAQYCMQCGTPAARSSAPGTPASGPDFLRPALIAGAVLGFLSSIPLVNLGNCVCCMWGVGGGGLGAWLLGRDHPGGPGTLSFGDGAFVGALSGLLGGVVTTVIGIPFRMLTATGRAEMEEMLLDIIPDIDPEMLEVFLQFADFSLLSVVVTLLMNVVMFSLFAMIGGILMVAIAGKKSAGPGVPRQPDDGPFAG
jgi:hypothetical protein